MKKARTTADDADMRPEYDFSGGIRGKYAERMRDGPVVVVLDDDVALLFPDAKSVNAALRRYAKTRPVAGAAPSRRRRRTRTDAT